MPDFLPCILCGNERYTTCVRNTVSVRECLLCGLQSLNPFPERPLDYSSKSQYENPVTPEKEESRRRNCIERFDLIVESAGGADRSAVFCDIGAHDGAFIRIVKEKGFDVWGIEPNAVLARLCQAEGMEVHKGTIEDLPVILSRRSRPTNVFALSHVIEHLRDPLGALCSLRDVAGKGSLIYVETPDARGSSARRLRDWRLYYSDHLWYFHRETLRALLEKAGLDVVREGKRDFDFKGIPLGVLAWRLLGTLSCGDNLRDQGSSSAPTDSEAQSAVKRRVPLGKALRHAMLPPLRSAVRIAKLHDFIWAVARIP